MRKIIGFAFLVAALAAAATASNAQPPAGQRQGGGFGGGRMGGGQGSPLQLVANASVQEELKITDEQKDKLKEVAAEAQTAMQGNRDKMMEMMKDLQDAKPEERMAKMGAYMKEQTAPFEKKVNEILKPDQTARLKQISLQQMGLAAFSTEDVAKDLAITDSQKEKFKELSADSMKDMREMMGNGGGGGGGKGKGKGGFDAETTKKMAAMRKEYNEKALAVLTDEQKATWKKMTGETFELKVPARPKKDD